MGVMVQRTGPSKHIYSGPMTDTDAKGADFLQLRPEEAPSRGLTGWLADAIRAAIMDGRLGAGAPLPATRLLAGDLGVSRGVIVEVYQRLADEGLVSARPGTGTRVLGVPRLASGASEPAGIFRDTRVSGAAEVSRSAEAVGVCKAAGVAGDTGLPAGALPV